MSVRQHKYLIDESQMTTNWYNIIPDLPAPPPPPPPPPLHPGSCYNAEGGVQKLTTGTGAGQWGAALAFACSLFDVQREAWQVGVSCDRLR